MKDFMNFTGHFKIQALDNNQNVVDEWEDNNLIMESARESMAEIFSSVNNSSVSKIVLGTKGHQGTDTVSPKTASEGFIKDRDRLFSQPKSISDQQAVLLKNDMIKYVGSVNTTATYNNYYIYIGAGDTINLATTDFSDQTIWEYYGSDAPYIYTIEFDLPEENNTSADNIKEYEYELVPSEPTSLGSNVSIAQTGTSTTFTVDIPTNVANYTEFGVFTEAALYANDRIFSMKTFRAKIKDNSVQLRILWTISF